MSSGGSDDRGSTPVEVALLAPVILALLLLVMFAARVSRAEAEVQSAVSAAARAASQQGDEQGATAAAQVVAQADLTDAGISCTNRPGNVELVAPTDFRPGGEVTVQVTCIADVSSVALVGIPGDYTFTATATETIDTYRGGG